MNPYSQLQMMQQAGAGQFVPGLGMMSPQAGGAASLQAMARAYGSPIAGARMADTSPMAALGYQGPMASLVNIGGNLALAPMMQSQGLISTGNAGSYQQALASRQFQLMQEEVSGGVAQQDAEALFRNIRGAAALAGMQMNRDQTQAARDLANTAASMGPTLGLLAPGLLDAISGDTGSVQAMASQLTQANRYRVDPLTGEMGFGAESNQRMVESLFEDMFNQDNIANMQGLRAGEMGELYSRFSAEGMIGSRQNLRDQTISALRRIQNEGGDIGIEGSANALGIDLSNLEGISNQDLAALRRESTTLTNRITESDTERISGQLQDYVKSLSAIREVFGENGNPNAPIPELIGALEALTNNKMQQFDASRLNNMVRDMQALSQASGKSIDQLTAMQQNNISQINSMTGYGGEHFAATSTNYGVTTGQAFQQVGGATGFGALSRAEAEQASQSLFNRSMDSEMANALGAIGRIEETAGINETPAGKDLQAAMRAVRNGDRTYTDSSGVTRRTPTREHEFRSFFARGAVDGVDASDFNLELGKTFGNREQLASDEDLQRGAVRQQFFEFERDTIEKAGYEISKRSQFEGVAAADRGVASRAVSRAASEAMFSLSAEDFADEDLRRRVMVNAIQAEAAGIEGFDPDDRQARVLADAIYNQSNKVARDRAGMSTLGLIQTQGRNVSTAQRSAEAQADSRAARNEALSLIGPKGSGMQRFFSALQKQGDRGEGADLTTLAGDIFGVEDIEADDLSESMQKVRDLRDKSAELSGLLDGAPPEEARKLREQLKQVNADLYDAAEKARDEATDMGLTEVEGRFNYADMGSSQESLREIQARGDINAVSSFLGASSEVTAEDRAAAADTELDEDDRRAMRAELRNREMENLGMITDEMIADPATAPENLREEAKALNKAMDREIEGGLTDAGAVRRAREGRADEIRSTDYSDYYTGDSPLGEYKDQEMQDVVIRNRRARDARKAMTVTEADIQERRKELYETEPLADLPEGADPVQQLRREAQQFARMSEEEFDEFKEDLSEDDAEQADQLRNQILKEDFESAQDTMIAERTLQQLGVIGKDQALSGKDQLTDEDIDDLDVSEDIRDMLQSGDPAQFREAANLLARQKKTEALRAGDVSAADIDKVSTDAVAGDLANIATRADEYLGDAGALARGGDKGREGALAVREAQRELQTLANRYSNLKGDRGAAELLDTGVTLEGVSEQAEKDFKDASKAEINALFDKALDDEDSGFEEYVKAEGLDIGNNLEDRKKAFVYLERERVGDRVEELREMQAQGVEDMAGGASLDYRNILEDTDASTKARELLEKTGNLAESPEEQEKQIAELAKNLESLQAAGEGDISEAKEKQQLLESAERSYEQSDLKDVMSLEEYKDIIAGGKNTDPETLTRVFGQQMSKEQVTEGKSNLRALEEAQRKVGRLEKLSLDKSGQKLLDNFKEQEALAREKLFKDKPEGMSEEDYIKNLKRQDDYAKLQEKADQYAEQGDVDESVIDALNMVREAGEIDAEKYARTKSAEGIISKALGIEVDDEDQADLGTSLSNQRLLADDLKSLEGKDLSMLKEGLDEDASGILKIDAIEDAYVAAEGDSKAKQELADNLGMSVADLEKFHRRNRHFKFSEKDIDESNLGDVGRDAISEGLKSVDKRDLEEEIKEEEDKTMRLVGTLNVTGVVNGQATLDDVQGEQNQVGAV
jgi:hypothetical protein